MTPTFRTFIVLSVAVLAGAAGWGLSILKEENHARHQQQIQQGEDREAATLKNVQARRSDCGNSNAVRSALRIGVEQGQKRLPLFLKTLPALNTKQILAINDKEVKRQLKAYAPLNCEKYALEALPAKERYKVSLEEQQRLLREAQSQIATLVHTNAESAVKAAVSRVTTVTQRCELTKLVLTGAVFRNQSNVAKLRKSLAGCEKSLVKVKAEATHLTKTLGKK